MKRSVTCGGASTKNSAASTGITAMSRRSFSNSRNAMPAQAPMSALLVNVRPRMTSSAGIISDGQIRSFVNRIRAAAAHVTSISTPGIRHVMAERTPRALAEIVELQHAELEDAVERAQRADGDDHLDDKRRLRATSELVDHRHDQEKHELLGVDEAGVRIVREGGRHQRERRIRGERIEKRRDLDASHRDDVREPHQQGEGEKDICSGNRDL